MKSFSTIPMLACSNIPIGIGEYVYPEGLTWIPPYLASHRFELTQYGIDWLERQLSASYSAYLVEVNTSYQSCLNQLYSSAPTQSGLKVVVNVRGGSSTSSGNFSNSKKSAKVSVSFAPGSIPPIVIPDAPRSVFWKNVSAAFDQTLLYDSVDFVPYEGCQITESVSLTLDNVASSLNLLGDGNIEYPIGVTITEDLDHEIYGSYINMIIGINQNGALVSSFNIISTNLDAQANVIDHLIVNVQHYAQPDCFAFVTARCTLNVNAIIEIRGVDGLVATPVASLTSFGEFANSGTVIDSYLIYNKISVEKLIDLKTETSALITSGNLLFTGTSRFLTIPIPSCINGFVKTLVNAPIEVTTNYVAQVVDPLTDMILVNEILPTEIYVNYAKASPPVIDGYSFSFSAIKSCFVTQNGIAENIPLRINLPMFYDIVFQILRSYETPTTFIKSGYWIGNAKFQFGNLRNRTVSYIDSPTFNDYEVLQNTVWSNFIIKETEYAALFDTPGLEFGVYPAVDEQYIPVEFPNGPTLSYIGEPPLPGDPIEKIWVYDYAGNIWPEGDPNIVPISSLGITFDETHNFITVDANSVNNYLSSSNSQYSSNNIEPITTTNQYVKTVSKQFLHKRSELKVPANVFKYEEYQVTITPYIYPTWRRRATYFNGVSNTYVWGSVYSTQFVWYFGHPSKDELVSGCLAHAAAMQGVRYPSGDYIIEVGPLNELYSNYTRTDLVYAYFRCDSKTYDSTGTTLLWTTAANIIIAQINTFSADIEITPEVLGTKVYHRKYRYVDTPVIVTDYVPPNGNTPEVPGTYYMKKLLVSPVIRTAPVDVIPIASTLSITGSI